MAENTNLRQATAKATSIGTVSEKDLKFYKVVNEEEKDANSEAEADGIRGSVTVKTGDTNFVRYNVKIAKKTKAGTENKAYPGIKTVMDEYISIANCPEGSEPDKVRVTGDINLYQGINGEEIINYKSNFFNRLKVDEEHPYEPSSEFDVELFIKSMVPEMDTEGSETGRIKISGVVPVYNGVEMITLIAPEEDGIAAAIDSSFEPGQTVEFFGNIINSRVEKITEIPVAIGKPRKKVETSYKNELIITGASEPYDEGVTPNPPYDADVIKAALQERTNKLEERKAKQQSGSGNSSARPSGASKGRTLGF